MITQNLSAAAPAEDGAAVVEVRAQAQYEPPSHKLVRGGSFRMIDADWVGSRMNGRNSLRERLSNHDRGASDTDG